MSVYAHRTEGVTEPEEQEGANGVGGGIGVRGRNGDSNEVGGRDGDMNDDGDVDEVGEEIGTGTGAGAGAGTGRER